MDGDLLSITHKQLWIINVGAGRETEVWLNAQKTTLDLIKFS
jgi:hypothetical protein